MKFAEFLKDQKIFRPRGPIAKPKVSVIMPTYCRARDRLLARAINSVLSQTFADFEFIIVDDGSRDGTEDIVRDFQKQDNRIIYVRHELNSGLLALRVDEGILLSRGDYLAFAFDDDEWLPLFLEVVINEAEKSGRRFVHSQAEYYLGERLFHPCFPRVAHPRESLLQRNKIANASVIVHRSLLEERGLYNPHVALRRSTDWELWLRLSSTEPPLLVPEVLVRIHGDLPDSVARKAAWFDHADFVSLALLSSPSELSPEKITAFEVASLEHYRNVLGNERIARFYSNVVLPWLEEHRADFVGHNIPLPEIVPEKATQCRKSVVRKHPMGLYTRFLLHAVHLWHAPLKPAKRSMLHRSPDLQTVPFLVYPLSVESSELCALELELEIYSPAEGTVGVEIVSPDNHIIAATEMPLLLLAGRDKQTARFYFEPPLSTGVYHARVYGRQLAAPLHVLDGGAASFLSALRRPCWRLYTV